MKNVVIGYVWGGERMTTDHRVIAELEWAFAPEVNRMDALIHAQRYIKDMLEAIMECDSFNDYDGLSKVNGTRNLPGWVTVTDWETKPEYWEIIYVDANGDHRRLEESD